MPTAGYMLSKDNNHKKDSSIRKKSLSNSTEESDSSQLTETESIELNAMMKFLYENNSKMEELEKFLDSIDSDAFTRAPASRRQEHAQGQVHSGPQRFSSSSVPVKLENSPGTWHDDKQRAPFPFLTKHKHIFGADRKVTANDIMTVIDTFNARKSYTKRDIVILTGTHGAVSGDNWVDLVRRNRVQRDPSLIESNFLNEDQNNINNLRNIVDKNGARTYSDEFINRIRVVDMDGMTDNQIEDYIKSKKKHIILAYCYSRNDEALRFYRRLPPVTSYTKSLGDPTDLLELINANVHIVDAQDRNTFAIDRFHDARDTNFQDQNGEYYMSITDSNGQTHIVDRHGDAYFLDPNDNFQSLPNTPLR